MTTTRLVHKDILDLLLGNDVDYRRHIAHMPDALRLNIDSRLVGRGDVFLALSGEHHDGHDYIKDARSAGAILIIAEDSRRQTLAAFRTLPIVFVPNTLKIFSEIAALHLQKMKAKKIAITGSNGKTTTKEMVKAALAHVKGREKVYSSFGNKNNHFGVPLSALEVTPLYDVAIFEMGMNHAGEIASLASIVEPDVGVITNISSAHSGNFSDGIEGVARAKGELFAHVAKTGGCAIINVDDKRVVTEASKHQWTKKVSFGMSAEADVRLVELAPFSLPDHSQPLVLSIKGGDKIKRSIPLPGAHHAHNATAALAVALSMGVSVKDASLGLMHMEKTPGRMSLSFTKDGILIIDDGYNANLLSMTAGMKASLDFTAARRIAVIGAMGELGQESKQQHFRLGQLLAQHFDHLFICGEETVDTVLGAEAMGFLKNRIVYKNSSTDLIAPLKKFLTRGDVVFIKGSLLANMRAVVDALLTS